VADAIVGHGALDGGCNGVGAEDVLAIALIGEAAPPALPKLVLWETGKEDVDGFSGVRSETVTPKSPSSSIDTFIGLRQRRGISLSSMALCIKLAAIEEREVVNPC
jgi:hypothetical protein